MAHLFSPPPLLVCGHFLRLPYSFSRNSRKIETTAFLRVETIAHFTGHHTNISKFTYALLVFALKRELLQISFHFLDHLKMFAAITAALHNIGPVL